jgi:glycosyltransferase involved in cell wall biosynthesis
VKSGSAADARIRLLFVISSLYIGGAQRQLVQLVQSLDPARYAITVAVFIGPEAARQQGFYRQLASLPNVSLSVLTRRGRFDVLGPVFSLVRLIRARDIQLMQTFLNLASTFGLIAARIAGIPILASAIRDSRDVGFVYRICRILQAYGTDILLSNSEAGFDNRFRHRRHNFRVVGNGMDLSRFESRPETVQMLRDELRLSRFAHLVGMVATLSAFKDQEAFLRIAARVVAERPGTGFLVVGDGPKRPALEALAAELGLARNVIFTGFRKDVDALTGMLDVACLFTNYRVISEGLPNAVMEAMACAVPVVATDGGGTVEFLRDGIEGYLVVNNDIDAAAARIKQLLANADLRRTLGTNGHETIRKRFGLDACRARHEAMYEELLNKCEASRREKPWIRHR